MLSNFNGGPHVMKKTCSAKKENFFLASFTHNTTPQVDLGHATLFCFCTHSRCWKHSLGSKKRKTMTSSLKDIFTLSLLSQKRETF